MATKQLLEGIRVLCLEQVHVLPIGTAYLADMGADVIRIEHPEHLDDRRSGPFGDNRAGEQWWNESGGWTHTSRNKKSIGLDVNTPRGREIFLELVKHSDIVADNFRTGTMERLGFDHDSLVKIKPDIITLTCNAFGSTGPYKRYGSRARTIDGFCGVSYISGYEGGPALRVSGNYLDQTGAVNNAFLLLMAIYRKRKTGKGMRIDASMYETGIGCIGPALLETQRGISQERMGSAHPYWKAPYNVYPTQSKDRWIAITVSSDAQWEGLKQAMGGPSWAEESRFATVTGRWANRKELDALLAGWTAAQDHLEATHLLQRHGVPAGAVLNAQEVVDDSHLEARRYFGVIQPDEARNLAGRAVAGRKFTDRPFRMPLIPTTIGPGPDLAEHNEELLQGLLGLSVAEVEQLEAEGAVLFRPPAKELANPPVPIAAAAAPAG